MSITFKRMLTIAVVTTSVSAIMLPTETIARDGHHHYAPRGPHRTLPSYAHGYVAPPADFYLTRPMPHYVGPVCDPARDWNC